VESAGGEHLSSSSPERSSGNRDESSLVAPTRLAGDRRRGDTCESLQLDFKLNDEMGSPTVKAIKIATCLALFGIIGCSGAGKPDNVAQKFWSADNIDAAKTYCTDLSQKAIEGAKEAMPKVEDLKVEPATITGDTAVCPTSFKFQGHEASFQTHLMKENGAWKVDYEKTMGDFASSAMKQGQDALKGAGDQAIQGAQDALKNATGGDKK